MPASTAKTGRKLPAWLRFAQRKTGPLTMFFKEFLKHPVMVGAIVPSSDALIARMLSRVDWANTKIFVEYGPGVGTFSRPILKKLPHDAQLVVIDTNPDFIDYLREDIPDPRFIPVLGSAADVRRIVKEVTGADHVDYVASGLPFSTLPTGIAPKIAAETHALLRTGGAFLVYQYSPKCRSYMAPHFDRIDHDMEWWNVPPAQLYWAWKD
ncbi:class I SAM-dependent methyltransferase [Sphingobium boeckii]|uniref:Phospholipid N-methyltransferase n=1 Tax=Sphingobium boeckii TaxID=1082345 RepID=A0A7W9AJ15_9SPHN|nr:methyltransferase domain-containing protein [Sphingobium boeckii]MBB5686573.1 phospholipid N-methyltransferase [Sphingobium boeckii]